jgi:hypothetical protein
MPSLLVVGLGTDQIRVGIERGDDQASDRQFRADHEVGQVCHGRAGRELRPWIGQRHFDRVQPPFQPGEEVDRSHPQAAQ